MIENTLNWLAGLPLWSAVLFLFGIVFMRAQMTFWLGKLAYKGLLKTKLGKKLRADEAKHAGIEAIQKFGWPIIPLSFLTVGFQSAVQFAAGLSNWKWYKYTLAAIPGYLAWGFIYALGGLNLFQSIVKGSIGQLIIVVIIILVLIVLANILMRYIRRT